MATSLKSLRLKTSEFERKKQTLLSIVDKAHTRGDTVDELPLSAKQIAKQLVEDYEQASELVNKYKGEAKEAEELCITLNKENQETAKHIPEPRMAEQKGLIVVPKKYGVERGLAARQWIRHFKLCYESNEWTELQAIKKMSAYLEKSALSWYMVRVLPKNIITFQ